LVAFIARALVEDQGAVEVEEVDDERNRIIKLRVAPGDLGRVIGKEGNTARAIRTILGVATSRDEKKAKGTSGAWQEAQELFLGKSPGDVTAFRVMSIRGGGRFVIVALEGIKDRNEAEKLKGLEVFVSREQLPDLEEDTYYASDLLGMEVRDEQGRLLGELQEIFDNGAHEVYVVRNDSTKILIPVVQGVVVKVDRGSGKIVVNPPEGLPGL
jgi:16S rRNA processing protein RimM